jgi:uncharacterized protein (DUF58 family)
MALLSAAILSQLDALRAQLRTRVTSRHQGERKSATRGAAGDFFGHRPYAAGDDLRRVDWKAYARSGHPVLKQFRTDEELMLRVVVDSSASQGGYFDQVQQLAAAIAYVALGHGERVQLFCGNNAVRLNDLPRRTLRNYPAIARGLELQVAGGVTSLSTLLRGVLARASRAGALVILSDFLAADNVDQAVRELRRAGHEPILVHCMPEHDDFADLWGDCALEDCETGEVVDVTIDDALLADIDAAQRKHVRTLEALADGVQGRLLNFRSGTSPALVCAQLFGVGVRDLRTADARR